MRKLDIRSATNEELLKRFEASAIIHRALTDPKKANAAFDEGIMVWKELSRRGKSALDLFLVLLDSPNPAIRMNAAALALFISPEKAESILDQLTKEPRSLGMSAAMTLKEWKAGRLKPFV